MVAEFRGPSPHDLGTAELATARVVDESIEVTLHLLDDWHRPMGPIIQVRMTPTVARSLAERLTAAAEGATVNFGSTASSTPPRRRCSRSPGFELPMRLERPGTFFR